jgi:trans-aconitate methyltransferase
VAHVEDAIAAANALLRSRGYTERDLAVYPAHRGKALLKGNKLLSPLSDDPELLHRLVRDLVPESADLGTGTLRPADLRANL